VLPDRNNNSVTPKLTTGTALVSRPKGLPVTTTSLRVGEALVLATREGVAFWACAPKNGAHKRHRPTGQARREKTFMI
jgi:hypothetical protein